MYVDGAQANVKNESRPKILYEISKCLRDRTTYQKVSEKGILSIHYKITVENTVSLSHIENKRKNHRSDPFCVVI